jgi:cobalamin biosynthesis Mg chelatase CobN
MLKRLAQLTIIGFLLCSLPMPVEARSSSSSSSSSSSKSSSPSSSSSSSSFRSSPSTTSSSYSRSSSTSTQTKPSTSSSSSNSSSAFGSSFNSSYSSRPVTKPAQAVTTEKPKTPTTYMPEYKVANPTGGKTETKYVTIFSDSGTRTVPVIVPFGYTQQIVLPNTYYPANTTVVASEWSVWTLVGRIIGFLFIVFVILVIIAGMR